MTLTLPQWVAGARSFAKAGMGIWSPSFFRPEVGVKEWELQLRYPNGYIGYIGYIGHIGFRFWKLIRVEQVEEFKV